MNKIKTQMFIVVGILTYSILPAELVELTNYEMSVIKGGAVSVNSCGEGVSGRCPNEPAPSVECTGTALHWGYYCQDSFWGKYNKACAVPPPECDICAMNKNFTCKSWTLYAKNILDDSGEYKCVKWIEYAGNCGENGTTTTPFPKRTCK